MPKANQFKVAAVQMAPVQNNTDAAGAKVVGYAQEAAAAGAKVIGFPEAIMAAKNEQVHVSAWPIGMPDPSASFAAEQCAVGAQYYALATGAWTICAS